MNSLIHHQCNDEMILRITPRLPFRESSGGGPQFLREPNNSRASIMSSASNRFSLMSGYAMVLVLT